MKAEMDWIDPPPPQMGAVTVTADDEEHGPHNYLYLPDLSSQTGWAAHRVPERKDRQERREMGFRR